MRAKQSGRPSGPSLEVGGASKKPGVVLRAFFQLPVVAIIVVVPIVRTTIGTAVIGVGSSTVIARAIVAVLWSVIVRSGRCDRTGCQCARRQTERQPGAKETVVAKSARFSRRAHDGCPYRGNRRHDG